MDTLTLTATIGPKQYEAMVPLPPTVLVSSGRLSVSGSMSGAVEQLKLALAAQIAGDRPPALEVLHGSAAKE